MKESNNKIRIKDIATMAGVSEGTVDRVIHKRGEVSAKSLEAVNKVLKEINYQPNILARSLASKKQYRFVCLFPEHQTADYWQNVESGFDLAAIDFSQYNVIIEKRYFNQFDTQSFELVSQQVIDNCPDAVIIAPIFKNETIDFTKQLSLRKIPFSFIDSMIENTGFLTYYGQHSLQSGYIAAKLLLSTFCTNDKVLVIRTKRNGAVSNQTLNRHKGFLQYFEEQQLTEQVELINIELVDDDENKNRETLNDVFVKFPEIKAAITFNSKVYRLANHLEALNRSSVRLIGYDLLEQNIAYLKRGTISYLIAQRPDKQAYFSVRDICRELIFKQDVSMINYVPIDILISENIDYYTQFRE